MKKLLLTLTMLLATYLSYGQYYMIPTTNNGSGLNPGNLFSDPEQPGTYAAAPWSAAFATMPTTASWSNTINVPFSFNFNGNNFNQVKVSNSGVLTFTTTSSTAPAYGTRALPASGVPDNSICVLGLQNQGSNDLAYTATLGTAPNRQFWVAYSSYGQAVANWTGTALNRWTYWAIVLEETTNNVYIIDQRTGNVNGSTTPADNVAVSAGLQFSSTSAISVPGSPSLASNNLNTGSSVDIATDNTIYAFYQGVQPRFNLKLTSLVLPKYYGKTSGPLEIKASGKNIGSDEIKSVHVGYSVNGNSAIIDSVGSLSIPTLTSGEFASPSRFTFSANGTYEVKLWVNKVNGSALASVDTVRGSVIVTDTLLTRRILQEGFSSSTCPPCSLGNIIQRQAETGNENKIVRIKLQQNFPAPGTDPNQTSEAISRRGVYSVNSIPTLMVDGTKFADNSQLYTAELLNEYASEPSFVKIRGSYRVTGRTVDMNLNIRPFTKITGTDNYLFVAIKEKTITHGLATNGESVFKHVLRKMVPDQTGTLVLPLDSAVDRQYSLSYTFPNTLGTPLFPFTPTPIKFDSLEVAVWIQNTATKSVLQAYELSPEIPVKVKMMSLKSKKVVFRGAPVTISATFRNAGGPPIESYKLNYQIGNGPVKTITRLTSELYSGSDLTIQHDSIFLATVSGNFPLKVWVSEVNNITPLVNSDTLNDYILVIGTTVPRTSLVETFTSSGISSSVTINPIIDAAARNNNAAVNMRFSMNSGSYVDPLNTVFANDRYRHLTGSSALTPSINQTFVYINGKNFPNPQQLTKAKIDSINNADRTIFSITGTVTRVNANSVRINANVTPSENFPAMNVSWLAFIGERYSTHNQATNGEVDFFDPVLIMNPSSSTGQLITTPWNTASPVPVVVSRQLNSTSQVGIFSRDSLYCVLAIQDNETKEILQASYIHSLVSINPTDINSTISKIYPNPNDGSDVNVEFNLEKDADVTVSVFNTIGAKVAELKQGRLSAGAQKTVLNVNKLPQGIYTVKVQAGSEVSTDRLVITK